VAAAAAVTAAALALAGCKSLGVTVDGHHHHKARHHHAAKHHPAGHHKAKHKATPNPPAGATVAGDFYTEPAAGFSVVYNLIDHAKKTVDLVIFELKDTDAEHALGDAARRGVRVRVILDDREKSTNSDAAGYLTSRGAKVVWSSSRFKYTHQKTLIVDGSTALIMSANLTSQYYPTTRDFLVRDTRAADVNAIEKTFDADFAHQQIDPPTGADLLWSPTNAKDQMLALINGAKHTIRVYDEELSDSTIVTALANAAKRGVDVEICGENQYGHYDRQFTELTDAGAKVTYFSSSHGFYIHAKVLEVDEGTARAQMYVGSENFTTNSLRSNRELGLILSGKAVLRSVARTFDGDFRKATPFH
jgi:phosphatidylserine/phosphatidylglycerophosphate/cardiolipin synthase-like enzyme